jgi:acetoin utilization deacetylase AcuC-like enzyme
LSRTLYYCDHLEFPLPVGHKFPVRKYALIRELLGAGGDYEFRQAPFAAEDQIARVHDPAYVRAFLEGSLPERAMRRIGFPWSEGLVRRTLASVGGTLAACELALAAGFGGNLAGGTHHAFRAEGSGFCVFNDLAVAIVAMREQRRIARAAVIDLDVHQGDGTATLFENDPDVLTVSLHARNNFPFRKQRGCIDIELEDGAGDEAYLIALESVLPRVFAFRPDLVLYQSGVDGLATDRLGRLALTHHGLVRRDRLVMESCRSYGAPIAITLGGGYSEPIEFTAEAHANTFLTAAEVFGAAAAVRNNPPEPALTTVTVGRIIDHQAGLIH